MRKHSNEMATKLTSFHHIPPSLMFLFSKKKRIYSKTFQKFESKKIQPKSAWRKEVNEIYKSLARTLSKGTRICARPKFSLLGQSFSLLILMIDGFRNHIIFRIFSENFCIVEDYY